VGSLISREEFKVWAGVFPLTLMPKRLSKMIFLLFLIQKVPLSNLSLGTSNPEKWLVVSSLGKAASPTFSISFILMLNHLS
jgi:hypothetical protein